MQVRHLQQNQNQKLYQQLRFLQNENQRLKQQLSDSRDLIKMNKIQIDVLSKNQKLDKKLIDVIYNYRQQQEQYQKKQNQVSENYHKITSQKLVIEQLYQQLQSEQKALQDLHKIRIKQLSDLIKGLQQKIAICEKSHQNYDSITGFVEKNKQIFNPLDQALQFKSRQSGWMQQVAVMKDQLEQHKKNEENLLLANGVIIKNIQILRNKVVSLQAKLAMPNKNLGEILDKSLKRLMLYFIETQKKMLTGDDSDSEEEDLELIAPELMSLFPQKIKTSSDFKVPPLDLLKVRCLQLKGNQKIKQDLDRRKHLSHTQKVERFEIQIQFTRRQLTKTMIELKSQSQRRKILECICQDLDERNNILIKSNQNYKKKFQSIRRQYHQNKQKLISLQKLQSFQQNIQTTLMKKDSFRRPNDKQREQQVNKYLEKVQTPFQFKLHLKLLAKDLNRNTKLSNLNETKMRKNDGQQSGLLKRSTSNPFLYFNERKDSVMQAKPERQAQDDKRQRLEQTQMLLGQKLKFDEEFEEFDDL